ncbi:MAG: type II toxin-antitoxin system RelE/ParE family toxin [Alphaproteobacteria bacterium]|nr:type II toxin-antitoxin system RelE/ParE family toxin [Alphaproteobacteria bacterium]
MPRYQFAPSARQDISDVVAHIRLENPFAAKQWFSVLREKCQMLAGSPRVGRVRDELMPNVHVFPFGNYLIFYDIVPGGILVVHVVHAARDVPRVFSQESGPA